jgi:hypothetical protein
MDFLPDGTLYLEDPAALKIPETSEGSGATATLQGPGSGRRLPTLDTSSGFIDDGTLRVADPDALAVPDPNTWRAADPITPVKPISGSGSNWEWDWETGLVRETWMSTIQQDQHAWEKVGRSWDWLAGCCEECKEPNPAPSDPTCQDTVNWEESAWGEVPISYDAETAPFSIVAPGHSWHSLLQQPQLYSPLIIALSELYTLLSLGTEVHDTGHQRVPFKPPHPMPKDSRPLIVRTDKGLFLVGWYWDAAGASKNVMCEIKPKELPRYGYNCIGYALGIYRFVDTIKWVHATIKKSCAKADCKKPCPKHRPIKIKTWFFSYQTARKVKGRYFPSRDTHQDLHMVRINEDGRATSKSGGNPVTSTPAPPDTFQPVSLNNKWLDATFKDGTPGGIRFFQSEEEKKQSGCYCCEDLANAK